MLRLRFQIGGKERARNLLQDAPENDSVAARGVELWPFEGSQVPEHDFATTTRGIKEDITSTKQICNNIPKLSTPCRLV